MPDFHELRPDHPMIQLERIFVPGFEGLVTMPSGRVLEAYTTEDEVLITDMANPRYHFGAGLLTVGGKEAISFNIDTRDKLGENQRHPDLYAALLMSRTLVYFEQTIRQGILIPRLVAQWAMQPPPISDNFIEYERNLRTFGGNRQLAAQRTWTGQQATRLGFTIVTNIWQDKDAPFLGVYFDRELSDT